MTTFLRRFGRAAIVCALVVSASPARAASSDIRHVFTIVLENNEMATTFGAGQAAWPYLARELPLMGVFVPNYYGIGHNSLDNYIAMVSGQGPNAQTQGDCEDPSTLGGGGAVTFDADGQAIGSPGCAYPASVDSIATQLTAAGKTWKGYMEDMDASQSAHRTTCRGPYTKNNTAGDIAGVDKSPDDYRAKHNPFPYFHAIFDDLAYCDANDLPLTSLESDLKLPADQFANYSMIVPNQCNDAHDIPTCSDSSLGGPQRADAWLQIWIPRILDSAAYKDGGLIMITFDEAIVPTSCCGEKKAPNLASNNNNGGSYGPFTQFATGGGQAGAILISPTIPKNTVSLESYNHYSYLRSMEDIFGLPHLGYAAQDALKPFGSDIYAGTVVDLG